MCAYRSERLGGRSVACNSSSEEVSDHQVSACDGSNKCPPLLYLFLAMTK